MTEYNEVLLNAKILEVLAIEINRGRGVDDDPVRKLVVFFTKDGKKIGELPIWMETLK